MIEEYLSDVSISLARYGYQTKESQSIVNEYRPIIENIGYDFLPEEWAEKLHQALSNGVGVERWKRHCEMVDGLEIQILPRGE